MDIQDLTLHKIILCRCGSNSADVPIQLIQVRVIPSRSIKARSNESIL